MSVDSDYRLRGYSLSSRRPVATLGLSYDHDSGVYLNGSATAVLNAADHVDLLAVEGGVGYARRIGTDLSIDGGVMRSEYRSGFAGNRGAHYTELYLGVTGDRVSSHLYYSPDYLTPGVSTLYGEVEVLAATVEKVRISGHIGMLTTLSVPDGMPMRKVRYDWRVGLARQFGAVELHAALNGGGPGRDYYARRPHSKTALTGGVSWFF